MISAGGGSSVDRCFKTRATHDSSFNAGITTETD
jgi:hypothetical protein